MEVIDKINRLLYEKGITGAELSRCIGLSNAVYSQWNTGKNKPSKKTLKKIADYFNVPVSYLTSEENETPTTKSENHISAKDIVLLLHEMTVDELWEIITAAQNELKERS